MFFINNPWTLVISIVIIVFLILMGVKIGREISLNALLKQKHNFMRVDSNKADIGFRKRIGVLTSAALAPVAVVAVVLIVGSNVTSTPTGQVRNFESSNDVEMLYDRVSNILPHTKAVEDVEYSEDSFTENIDNNTENYVTQALVSDFYTSITATTVSGNVFGADSLQKLRSNDDYYYEALDNNIEITLNSNDGTTKSGTQFVDSIVYTGVTGSCENGFLLKGLYLSEEFLTVVALEYPTECVGITMDEQYLQSNLNVLISVFDVNDFSHITNYRLSGNLASVSYVDDVITVVTKRYLDYDAIGFNLDDHLPYYKIGGSRTRMNYEDIIYVEGTSPESYTSVFSINLQNKEVDMESILLDYYSDIYMEDDKIRIVGMAYYLDPLAGMFDVDDPVDETRNITFNFTLNDGVLEYKGNEIK